MEHKLFVGFIARKAMMKKNGKTPIYCRVRFDGTVSQFNTKIDVSYKNWDSLTTKVIGVNRKEKNQKLDKIKVNLIEKFDELAKTSIIITAKTIVDYYQNGTLIMNSIINVFLQHNKNMQALIGKEYKYGSFKNYKTTIKHLRSYIQDTYNTQDILLNKINYDFIYNFSQYILLETECNHNGMMKHMQRLKKVSNFCIKHNYISQDPFIGFKISFRKTNRVYLSKQELYTLKNVALNKSLSRVRDIFLFSCYTGLSYIDVYKLKIENIKIGEDGFQWIYIKRQKTDIPSNLPLLPPALFILKKYNKHINEGKIFPLISNQKVNKALKAIAVICEFNKNITFHSARHTFATTVTLTNGVPIETVSKMLGHNNIKTTQIYAQVIESKISADMLILRQKLV
jgi:site-specific recombinase XerD|tara:strand:- start:6923 stop:8116 length:1194 start_codon:yes stop_codon:yes gene_type:complete